MEIILGKWLAALALYAAMLGISLVSMATLFAYGKPDWRPMIVGYLGLLAARRMPAGDRHLHLLLHAEPDCRGGGDFQRAADAVGDRLGVFASRIPRSRKSSAYLSVTQHFDSFSKGVLDAKDILYYASMIFIGLFLTARSLESLRWRA